MSETSCPESTLDSLVSAGKVCTRCGTRKSFEEFSRRVAMIDGHRSQCKACDTKDRGANAVRAAEVRRVWRAENHERERSAERARYARNAARERARKYAWNEANPEKLREIKRRHREKHPERQAARMERWRLANADHVVEYNREYRAANIERRRLAVKAWKAANPDRVRYHVRLRYARKARAPSLPFTAEQLAARLSMFAGCWVCGGPAEAVDHMKPLNKGGWDALLNLRPICGRHNSVKKDRWFGAGGTIRFMRERCALEVTAELVAA